MYETTLTIVGNLTDDVELRYTPAGVPVAKFRIASTPRVMDKTRGEWIDGEPLFMTCSVWREYAENVAESISRGTRVVVTGRLRQRSYETREGEKRTAIELEVDEVGVALRYVTAKPTKLRRGAAAADVSQERRAAGQDRTRQTAMAGAGAGWSDDEPPF